VPRGGFGSVTSLKALGYKPFYNKLNVAGIGCGGQGAMDITDAARTESIVALCDVDEARGAEVLGRYNVPKYKDFRVMLDKEEKNIEACTIAIPDFMHATVALACMQRGIHVYLEKPLTRTPWEARLLQDAAVKYKVATQMGNQGFSMEGNRVAAEIVWSGEIGDVKEAHFSTSPGTFPTGLQAPPKEAPIPKTLDWGLWLGWYPMRPFSEVYVPQRWRGFPDFGDGQVGSWAVHTAGPIQMALQLGAPTSVECIRQEGASKISMPIRGVIRFEFPARGEMPPVTVYYHDSTRPGDPEAFKVPGMEQETILPPIDNLAEKGRWNLGGGTSSGGAAAGAGAGRAGAGRGAAGGTAAGRGAAPAGAGGRGGGPQTGVLAGNGSVLIGTKGIMAANSFGGSVWLLPAARWKDYQLPPQLLTRSPGHISDWIRACKGGEMSCSDFSIAAPYSEWVVLTEIAWRVPGKLQWDAKNLRFTNSAEANKYVRPEFKKGWELKL
jgi:hypothetical protein